MSLSRVVGEEKWRNEGRSICVNLGGVASCDELYEVAVVEVGAYCSRLNNKSGHSDRRVDGGGMCAMKLK